MSSKFDFDHSRDQKIRSNQQMVELLKVVIKTVAGHQNGRKTRKMPFCIFSSSDKNMVNVCRYGQCMQGKIGCTPFPYFDFIL